MSRRTDKRTRLIEAAQRLVHQKGFNQTTLADIAQQADVPLGNVYYYYKTKEAIGEAIIEKHAGELVTFLSKLDEKSDPRARLMALLKPNQQYLELIARFGCPIGSLCQELGKQGGSLVDQAAKLLHDLLTWCETQFRALGMGEEAPDLALNLVSGIQGIYLLTHTFKDPNLAVRLVKNLKKWLESKSQVEPVSVANAVLEVV